jgi:hypothetical protein
MVPRDLTLSSLYDARRKLGELIVRWSPDPAADAATREAQIARLEQLILERDRVNGAISGIIGAEFEAIASPELMQAAQALPAIAEKLEAFGKSIAEVNEVLKVADEIVQGAAKVLKLAAGGAP